GARAIFVGAVEPDSSGYPGCRPAFYRAYEEAIRLGTRPETSIRIETPVIGLRKADIVRRGTELRVPFEKTWSCYQAEDEACGVCESCRLRLRGFAEARLTDPVRYRAPVATRGREGEDETDRGRARIDEQAFAREMGARRGPARRPLA